MLNHHPSYDDVQSDHRNDDDDDDDLIRPFHPLNELDVDQNP